MAIISDYVSSPKTLKVEEQIEGESIETNDYFFCKVGDSIPLMSDGSAFDANNPPAIPLAISQRSGLIFAAHSSGFCVAKTTDVIAAAKEIKEKGSGPSVQELSVVDVPIGRVSILALSIDCSFISAVVGGEIQCFSVDSLLKKDKKPTFFCSVESNHVKDMLWLKETEPSFIILTSSGKVFVGAINKNLKHVMDEVDAVGRSVDGNFVAVGIKNNLSIFSSKLVEISQVMVPLDTWNGDSDTIKVDSIRWVRTDSIVVGCFQQTEDGKEENYFLQVIMSKDGKIIDDSPKLTSVDFNDLFTGIVDDIVPCGCGPYLLVHYLENCDLAFVSNRKNTDQHIMLFDWSQGDNQVSVVDIERDSWLPRIELLENGDDNLVLGLCVDESSVYENVKVKIGVEEESELPTNCLLVCLTLEGKVVMFNVASIAGPQHSSGDLSAASSNAQSMSVVGPSNVNEAPLRLEEERFKQSTFDLGLREPDAKKISSAPFEVPVRKDQKPSEQNKYTLSIPNFDQNARKELLAGNKNQKAVAEVNDSKLLGQLGRSQEGTSNQSSFKNLQDLSSAAGDAVATEKWKIVPGLSLTVDQKLTSTLRGVEEKIGSGELNSIPTPTTSGSSLGSSVTVDQKLTSTLRGVEEKIGSGESNSIPTPTTLRTSLGNSGASNAKSVFSSQNFAKSTLSGNPLTSTDKANSSGSLFRNFGSHTSDSFNSSTGNDVNHSQKLITSSGFSGVPLSIPCLKTPLQESGKLHNFSGQSVRPMPGNDKKSSPLVQLNSEQNLPKQFSNVQNMAKELDKLLESIEEEGGFKDICTAAHRNSLEVLEDGMNRLSERNRMWQSCTEERLTEIQLLLDKTVQVLARKTHMEGIVRQTTDGQYWDLWNRQKLNSELDQKRLNVLNRSQDLINRMIELEKHFNTLELNLFGESSGANFVSRALNSRSASSRQNQSLHAIHNSTISQLAAAKQLSDSLSKQMDVLSIKSPPTKRATVKRQVFESIGIPYLDDSLRSPSTVKVMNSPSNRHPLVSCSGETRNDSRRIQSSGVSSHEPETARRRRDSLDRNWANFEAPKTTVKRTVVQNERQKVGSLFSSTEKQFISPDKLGGSIANYSNILAVQDRNGYSDTPQKINSETTLSKSKWAGGIPGLSQAETEHLPRWQSIQRDSFAATPNIYSSPSSLLSPFVVDPNTKKGNVRSTAERPGSQIGSIDRSGTASADTKPSLFFGEEKSNFQNVQPQLFPFPIKGGETTISGGKETELTKPVGSQSFLDISTRKQDVGASPSSFFPPVNSSSLPKLSMQTLPIISVDGGSTTSTKMAKDVNKEDIQFSSSVFSVSSSVAASLSSSTSRDSKEVLCFPMPAISVSATQAAPVISLPTQSTEVVDSVNLAEEPSKTGPQLAANKESTGNNLASTPQSSEKLALSSSDNLNSVNLMPPAHSAEIPKVLVSSPDMNKISTHTSGMVSNTPETQSAAVTSSSEIGGATSGKSNIDATVCQEDEMEEVAPETNQTAELSLGSLAGFGIGSAPIAITPKHNPFGGPITSAPQTMPSSISLTVPSGELFRPASFSFQPLQASQPSQSANTGAPSGAFGFMNPSQQISTGSGFGQSSQIGSGGGFGQSSQIGSGGGFGQSSQIGSGQQAMGSVLGSFGQSRQLGAGLPGSGFGVPQSLGGGFQNAKAGGGFAGIGSASSGFGGGFAAAAPTGGGFAAAAPSGGGFAAAAPSGGGFAAAATIGGGFAAAAPIGGGFAAAAPIGGGFAAAAPSGGGFANASPNGAGGFNAFGKQGTSGFSAFGGSAGGRPAPSELFTQMRK
ncbi:hypothetical protein SOVF_172500 [Spinacia oleracea]|nr:hypothetical protein SOVF_172500 [Spinacia oleracea]